MVPLKDKILVEVLDRSYKHKSGLTVVSGKLDWEGTEPIMVKVVEVGVLCLEVEKDWIVLIPPHIGKWIGDDVEDQDIEMESGKLYRIITEEDVLARVEGDLNLVTRKVA